MPENPTDLASTPSEDRPVWKAFRTGMLIAGSALLGGLAVVFWNRKSLDRLRHPDLEISRPPADEDTETE
ncbi:MAG TPA: hypothetical protein VIY53_04330 [Acidobacteriaceae bacterium]